MGLGFLPLNYFATHKMGVELTILFLWNLENTKISNHIFRKLTCDYFVVSLTGSTVASWIFLQIRPTGNYVHGLSFRILDHVRGHCQRPCLQTGEWPNGGCSCSWRGWVDWRGAGRESPARSRISWGAWGRGRSDPADPGRGSEVRGDNLRFVEHPAASREMKVVETLIVAETSTKTRRSRCNWNCSLAQLLASRIPAVDLRVLPKVYNCYKRLKSL